MDWETETQRHPLNHLREFFSSRVTKLQGSFPCFLILSLVFLEKGLGADVMGVDPSNLDQ